jgi:hypothetical protein
LEEDVDPEQDASWHIPGDELSFELGEFAHQQHIRFVRAVYALGSDPSQQVWLEGEPEEAAPERRDSVQKVLYTSRARVRGTISSSLPQGRYYLQRIEAHTVGGAIREFQEATERTKFHLPSSILVQREPPEGPILL